MTYTDNDLENIIAVCQQDDEDSARSEKLTYRCERALAYTYCYLHLTKEDRAFLQKRYDNDMDPDAKMTLEKILGIAMA